MRIVNWNIEWMNDWFVGRNKVAFRQVHKRGNNIIIADVADLCRRVASVIKSLDPDVLTVQEGPSDIREMQLFVETYLKDENNETIFDVFGGFDGRAQKVYALIKKQGKFKEPIVADDDLTLGLQEAWLSDVDGDYHLEDYEFTRAPLVIEGTWAGQDKKLKVMSLHTKSKYVHNQKELWEDDRIQFIILALKNRRRISSEAMRTRKYLDELIKTDQDALVVVTGDFNDGPGTDYFERYYLTHNITDILLGTTYYPELLFNHAFVSRVSEGERYTAIFDDFVENIPNKRILLDHILVSPTLSNNIQNSGIAHDKFNAHIDNNATGRQKYPSDHRPVFVDLK